MDWDREIDRDEPTASVAGREARSAAELKVRTADSRFKQM
jgi:hypothetical protein